jgi:hypothetical protein
LNAPVQAPEITKEKALRLQIYDYCTGLFTFMGRAKWTGCLEKAPFYSCPRQVFKIKSFYLVRNIHDSLYPN